MDTTTEFRRPRRSIRRWRPSVGLVVAAAVGALLPTAAFATHAGFGDGPFGPHGDGVHYMGETGITAGCGDGSNYCTDDAVTRAQMATFLHRMSGNGSIPPNVNAATVGGLSAADLRGQQAQIDATEAALNELVEDVAGEVSSLTIEADYIEGNNFDRWNVIVHGFGLVPGSTVEVTYNDTRLGEGSRSVVVADDGTVNHAVLNPFDGPWDCRAFDFVASGTSVVFDQPVVSEAVTPSGTPCQG